MNPSSRLRTAALVAAMSLSACGGGGGQQADNPPPAPAPPPAPRTGPAATTVIGQASFTDAQPNRGATVAADTLDTPAGNVAIADDGALFVPDSLNGRILAYRNVPGFNGAAAEFVVGKADVTAPASGEASRHSLVRPEAVSIADEKMVVADTGAHRILIYASVPSANGAPASFVVGQANFTAHESRGCFSHALNAPRSAVLTSDGKKLIVADTTNHRVLIWNTIPSGDGLSADVVLGQEDFTHCTANDANQNNEPDAAPTARTMNFPHAVWSDGTRLVVADTFNHRILIWEQLPLDSTQNFKPADIVLGQGSFASSAVNDANGDGLEDEAPGPAGMYVPAAVHSDGTRLAVADSGNNRVLVWNSFPTRSGTLPDRVFGQPDFDGHVENDSDVDGVAGPSAASFVMNQPRGVLIRGSSLFVSDMKNHRVLVFSLD